MHVVIKKTVFIKKTKEYLKDGNCMTSNIFVLNIHQFEDTKEWLKMVLLNHQAFFILNIHQFDATHLFELVNSVYFLFRVCVC